MAAERRQPQEALIHSLRPAAFALTLLFPPSLSPLQAQDTNGGSKEEDARARAVWRLSELRKGFCVQFLVAPGSVDQRLPEGSRLLSAGEISDLNPVLRTAVEEKREYGSWIPSHLCLFYLGEVEASGRTVRDRNASKAPVVGLWTVAAGESPTRRQDLAIEVLSNSGRLEGAAQHAGLDAFRMRSAIGKVPPDLEGVSSGDDRYEIRIGKTQLVWDGRPAADSARAETPVTWRWKARGRRGGWLDGRITLSPEWTRAMIGSLKVEGKGDLAEMLKASPVRFVGPAYQGGRGAFEFGR